jgi:pimeloyl-ACP methyl ester carboxylesterase
MAPTGQWQSQLVPVTGAQLHVVQHGQGPPVLLVHGFPLDHSMWRGQIEGLAETCRVIAPDLRGFGRSQVSSGMVTMEQLADDLAALLDALEIAGRITFCGLSMGGYVAWQFCLRHAPRLERLILCDTRAAADMPEVARARQLMASQVLREGPRVVAEGMLPKLFAPRTWQQSPELVRATEKVILATSPAAIAATLRGMAQRPNMTARLPELRVPALLVCGAEDAISPPGEMRQIAEVLPEGCFAEIPQGGHLAPLEQPDAVNRAIREFLATR